MALITCPDCGKQVSDAAPACVGCGRPMHTAAHAAAPEPKVLIEQSAKPFKIGMLIGIGMMVLCLFTLSTNETIAVLLLVVGFLVFIGSLIARWWQHG